MSHARKQHLQHFGVEGQRRRVCRVEMAVFRGFAGGAQLPRTS
jgi:hypothetical protein